MGQSQWIKKNQESAGFLFLGIGSYGQGDVTIDAATPLFEWEE